MAGTAGQTHMCSQVSQLRFYGRRTGRRLRPARRRLLQDLLPSLEVRFEPGVPLDPATLFDVGIRAVWLEIGFGSGEHLAWQAQLQPDIGFIGAEPYINGVASLLAEVDRRALENVRILPDDVRPLLASLPEGSIGRAFVLFPDPWPKLRHHGRRLVRPSFFDSLARLLPPGAELRLATDDPSYLTWILRHALHHAAFVWTARSRRDWEVRPSDWPKTRYEAKSLAAARRPAFLRLVRL